MNTYQQLTHGERYQIYALKKEGVSKRAIAANLGRHVSTIYRELNRNTGKRGYRPKQAHELSEARKQKTKTSIRPDTWQLIEAKIREEWSPEQISNWLKLHHDQTASHEHIYDYIYKDKCVGGDLYTHLRCQKPYRKRPGVYDRRGKLSNRVNISERPKHVEDRGEIGDVEIDTMIGKGHKGAMVTIVDRHSRYTWVQPLPSKHAQVTGDAIIELLAASGMYTQTITSDNGKEFADHQRIAKALSADFFFANPYASWERGTNENTNGLLRQYFPKSTDFTMVTAAQAQAVANKLNNRPRKCLDFRTPFEVFTEKLQLQRSVALPS